MASVTLLGLGNMGRVLANTLAAAGHQVTAWNRSARNFEPLHAKVRVEPDLVAACAASGVTIACLSSYAATNTMLASPAVEQTLAGRPLIQLSTGLPAEAAALAAWAAARGIAYLDGKIAVVPSSIGKPETVIFYAGDAGVYENYAGMLVSLGGKAIYLGTDVGKAAKADFSFLSFFFAATLGILYGSAFAQASGLDVEQFLDLIPSFSADILQRIPSFQKAIASGDFSADVQSTLLVDSKGAAALAETAKQLGLSSQLPDFLAACFNPAVAAALGQQDTGALVNFFRAPRER